ncbi:MAG TPA: potassium transporter TrkG [Thermoanaerobaculia bacterium]|nr:potassium transporter TrkG [Thermoanaerobaculia bacterium]HUM29247.1 potassium transporter TrkG [Thermoanaerobaculia bacterium]HXK67795.1 potassium transporter TrkG [Thermoanaerobaculia bacterium]
MNLRLISKILGLFTFYTGLFMVFPLLWSIHDRGPDRIPILLSMVITVGLGAITFLSFRKERGEIFRKEGIFIVTFSWIIAAAVGALPYHFTGIEEFPTYVDCFFESMSGFTTTGASVLTNIEALPRGILFWRSLTHWLGGMGIIVLFIAVLPFLGVGGRELYRSEVPGPTPEGLRPRIAQTARTLWVIYGVLTVFETLFLMLAGMNFFESLCHTFGTLATGGFSTRNTSIAAYDSVAIESIIILFMIAAGVNFSLYYQAIQGSIKNILKNTEFKVYIGLVAFLTTFTAITLLLARNYDTVGEALRYSGFQVVSILTTTGYATADFDLWPSLLRVLLVVLMFIGGCAGSTGGGMKVIRIIVLVKDGIREIKRTIYPRSVFTIKVGGEIVKDSTAAAIRGFFILFMLIFVAASLIMAGLGLDPVTAVTSVAATMGNIGPGLNQIGPTLNYAFIPLSGKILLSFCMLLGRLELFTVLVLLSPDFWKR